MKISLKLRRMGGKVLRIWEHEVEKNLHEGVGRIILFTNLYDNHQLNLVLK